MNFLNENQYEYLTIESIEEVNESLEMIDIEVEDDNTFCITKSNIVSHNCNNFIKGCTIPALRTRSSLIVVNHVYDDPSSLFSSKLKNQSGGKGMQYMARITLQCSKVFEKNDEKDDTFYKSTILKFFTVKNSFIKPFFESQMYLDFSQGPHKYFGLVKYATKWGLITSPAQGYYSIPSSNTPDKKWRMKALLDAEEEWEKLLPIINEKAAAEMYYSGGEAGEDYSDDQLDKMIEETEKNEENEEIEE